MTVNTQFLISKSLEVDRLKFGLVQPYFVGLGSRLFLSIAAGVAQKTTDL